MSDLFLGDNTPPQIELPTLPMPVTDEEIAAKLAAQEQEAMGDGEEVAAKSYDEEKHLALRLRVTAFADAAGAWKDIKAISSRPQAERLTDFIAGASGLAKAVESQRKADKGQWDAKAAEVQAAYSPMVSVLEKITALMKPMAAQWLRDVQAALDAQKERDRMAALEKSRAAEATARQAEIANDVLGMVEAAALQKEAEKDTKSAVKDVKASTASASGGTRAMSIRQISYAEITNQNAVYMQFRDHPRVIEVLQSLADAEFRGGGTVNGAVKRTKESV